jgi:hypothetical protein
LRLPSINLKTCFGDDTLWTDAADAAADALEEREECEECEEREECDEREEDKEALEERAAEPRRDDELDLEAAEERVECEAEEDFLGLGDIKGLCGLNTAEDDEDREVCEADEDEDREADEADEADDDIELLATGDILLYCSGVPEEGLPFAILRLTIACNIRACAFSIP